MSDIGTPFWETLTLEQMSDSQWESLCDGCGRCCLQKLEDEDSGEVWFTRISCKQLDRKTARCKDYDGRFSKVPDCLAVRPLNTLKISWLPPTCAYRKLALGESLASWHPLVSGRPESVIEAGISVAGRCVSETRVPLHRYFQYLIEWDDE